MAIAIKNIPTLEDKLATSFNGDAEKTYAKKCTVDFSQQIKEANAILQKSKLK
jgi:hypothetical protein